MEKLEVRKRLVNGTVLQRREINSAVPLHGRVANNWP